MQTITAVAAKSRTPQFHKCGLCMSTGQRTNRRTKQAYACPACDGAGKVLNGMWTAEESVKAARQMVAFSVAAFALASVGGILAHLGVLAHLM